MCIVDLKLFSRNDVTIEIGAELNEFKDSESVETHEMCPLFDLFYELGKYPEISKTTNFNASKNHSVLNSFADIVN